MAKEKKCKSELFFLATTARFLSDGCRFFWQTHGEHGADVVSSTARKKEKKRDEGEERKYFLRLKKIAICSIIESQIWGLQGSEFWIVFLTYWCRNTLPPSEFRDLVHEVTVCSKQLFIVAFTI